MPPDQGLRLEGGAVTSYTQRVHKGAVYTDGQRIAEVTRVYDLGFIQMRDCSTERTIGFGISAFRREWWLVTAAPASEEMAA